MNKLLQDTVVLLLIQLLIAASGEDVPCSPRLEVSGYVCVCNATYCDTIGVPTPLPPGQFYQYSSSSAVPGFTKTTGTFSKSDFTKKSPQDISDKVQVQVNASAQYQQLRGIGTALSDNSGIIINSLPDAAIDKLIESVFGENGIELGMIRLPISGSDFSPRVYTYDDVPGDVQLNHWNLTTEDLTIKLPLLKKFSNAYKREGGIKIYAVSWTAPNWMKTSNASRQGYVKNQYFSAWANYHAKFLQAYKDGGIDIWAISHGNEQVLPLYFGTFFGMPNTVWMPNAVRLFHKKYLMPVLKKYGFENVKIYTLDDERPFLNWWSDRLFKDNEVRDQVAGTALHWYLDSNTTISRLEDFHEKYPEKELLYTESSINSFQSTSGQAVDLGSWDSGVRYINNMYQNLCHWVTAYLDWNVALDTDGGPLSTDKVALDASIIINKTLSEFYKQPIYYILGHFSKFILPGAYRVQTLVKQDSTDPWSEECYSTPTSQPDDHQNIRFEDEDATTTKSPFPTRKPDPPSTTVLVFAASNPDGSHTIVTYNPRQTTVALTVNDVDKGTFEATLEPLSMNTFIYW